jgi:hypothetical protein
MNNLTVITHTLRRVQEGKFAVDFDRLPQAAVDYLWAVVMFSWALVAGQRDVPSALLIWSIILLLVGIYVFRVNVLMKLASTEGEILDNCRDVNQEYPMQPEHALARDLVRGIDNEATEWFPPTTFNYIVDSVMNDGDLAAILAQAQPKDRASAPFSLMQACADVIAIACAVKMTLEFVKQTVGAIELGDKLVAIFDDNRKLEIAEKVVLRLKQIGLEVSASRVQGWIDKVLEEKTRPDAK